MLGVVGWLFPHILGLKVRTMNSSNMSWSPTVSKDMKTYMQCIKMAFGMLNLHILCEHYYYNYYVSLYSFMFEDG